MALLEENVKLVQDVSLCSHIGKFSYLKVK